MTTNKHRPARGSIVDIYLLHEHLNAKRMLAKLSWKQVAAQAGVSASTLTRLARGHRPDLDGFGRLVSWLGLSADEFIGDGKRPIEGIQLPAMVARHLRRSGELRPSAARAMKQIVDAAYEALRAQ